MSLQTIAQAKSRVGVAVRKKNAVAEAEARRELAVAKLEQYIGQVLATAPPLTKDQKNRLSVVLSGGDAN